MTSPTDIPPKSTEEKTTPKTKSDEHVEIGGVRVPLPRWARFVIGVIAILGAAVPAVRYFMPPVTPTTAASPAQKNDQQYTEYRKHISESPEYTQTLFEQPDLGTLTVKFYASDGCLLVLRKYPSRYDQLIPYWIPKASIESDKAPGQITHNLPLQGLSTNAAAQIAPGSLLLATVANQRSANCLNPHPGEFRWWNGERRGCWIAVWRQWQDGCQHYQWFNTCAGIWDSDGNGAPRVYWTSCVH